VAKRVEPKDEKGHPIKLEAEHYGEAELSAAISATRLELPKNCPADRAGWIEKMNNLAEYLELERHNARTPSRTSDLKTISKIGKLANSLADELPITWDDSFLEGNLDCEPQGQDVVPFAENPSSDNRPILEHSEEILRSSQSRGMAAGSEALNAATIKDRQRAAEDCISNPRVVLGVERLILEEFALGIETNIEKRTPEGVVVAVDDLHYAPDALTALSAMARILGAACEDARKSIDAKSYDDWPSPEKNFVLGMARLYSQIFDAKIGFSADETTQLDGPMVRFLCSVGEVVALESSHSAHRKWVEDAGLRGTKVGMAKRDPKQN